MNHAVHQGHKYLDSVTSKENTEAQCGFPSSSLLFSATKTPLLINAIKQTLDAWRISRSGTVEMHLTSAFHKFLKSGEKRTNEIIQSNSSHLGRAGSPSLNHREAYAAESSFVWVWSVTQERELVLSGKAGAHIFLIFLPGEYLRKKTCYFSVTLIPS